jgi:hypothetical protein
LLSPVTEVSPIPIASQAWDDHVSINGAPVTCKLLHGSPGWLETMKIPLLRGRDLRHDFIFPYGAIVSEVTGDD